MLIDTHRLRQTWDVIRDRQTAFVVTFYARLFEYYPQYRRLFPGSIDHQMRRMVKLVASFGYAIESNQKAMQDSLRRVGERHRQYRLDLADLQRFQTVFLEVLGEFVGDSWDETCRQDWERAFAKIALPGLVAGMVDETAAQQVISTEYEHEHEH